MVSFNHLVAVSFSISPDLWQLIDHVALRYKSKSVNYGYNSQFYLIII
jgi:hypothetical protein